MPSGPQLEDGYTRIAHELLEAIYQANLSGNELRLVLFVIRRTYGYGKTHDWIAERQFCAAFPGLDRRNIARTRKRLIEWNFISVTKDTRGHPMFGIQKDYSRWITPSSRTHLRHPGRRKRITPSPKTHECVTKDTEIGVTKDGYNRQIDILQKKDDQALADQNGQEINPPILELTADEINALAEASHTLTDWKQSFGDPEE